MRKSLYLIVVIVSLFFLTMNTQSAIKGINSFDIKYETNGGEDLRTDYINVDGIYPEGESMLLLTPSKTNFIFEGWFYNPELTIPLVGNTKNDIKPNPKYDNDKIVGYNDVTLYAKWKIREDIFIDKCEKMTINTFEVIYNTNSDKAINSNTICINCDLNSSNKLIPVPKKDRYNFAGWYYDVDFKNKVKGKYEEDIIPIAEMDSKGCQIGYKNVILYAKWEPINYPEVIYLIIGTTIIGLALLVLISVNKKKEKKVVIDK